MSSAYLTAHYAVAPVRAGGEPVGWAVLRYEHHSHRVVITYGCDSEGTARRLCRDLNDAISWEVDYSP